jgi:hypothetical protein
MADTCVAGTTAASATGDAVAPTAGAVFAGAGVAGAGFADAVGVAAGLADIARLGGVDKAAAVAAGFAGLLTVDGGVPPASPDVPSGEESADA